MDLTVASDVFVGRRVRIDIGPRTRSTLRIGPGCRLDRDVYVELKGGTIDFGPGVEVRHATRLNVAGHLHISGPTIFGEYCTIHCRCVVNIGPMTSFSERVVITDSSHFHEGPEAWFYHSVKDGAVHLGRNSWVAAGAVITRNCSVGDYCIVGANSVVVDDVPDGHLASGIPATTHPLGHWWLDSPDDGPTRGADQGPGGKAARTHSEHTA